MTRRKAAVMLLILAGVSLAGGGAVYGALGDLVFEREGGDAATESILPAVFPHWVHRARYRCYVCHPKPFEMQQGANAITMQAIQNGELCGACHNGRIAFDVDFQSCARCHKESEE